MASASATIPAGYKQTEVGVIPEDWVIKNLDEISECLDSMRVPLNGVERKKIQGEIPYCGANGVVDYIDDYIFKEDIILIAEDGGNFDQYESRPIAYRMSGKCWVNNHAHVIRSRGKCDQDFIFFSLVHKNIVPYISGGTRAKLTRNELNTIPLGLPPNMHEQKLIAKTLSDIFELEIKIENLIGKKRNFMQGTMQKLLTGKTRLPGFTGEWENKLLEEVAKIKTGNRNNQDKIDNGKYPFFVRSQTVERIDTFSHDCEAILVPGDGKIGSIFHYINGRFDVHQRVYAITRFDSNACGKYILYFMSNFFGSYALENTVKATVDSLRLPTFQNFVIHLPPTIEEQEAIAEVLSDMDAEIAALEQRLEKTKAIKQGMMQQLLTGRIRLVDPSTPVEASA